MQAPKLFMGENLEMCWAGELGRNAHIMVMSHHALFFVLSSLPPMTINNHNILFLLLLSGVGISLPLSFSQYF